MNNKPVLNRNIYHKTHWTLRIVSKGELMAFNNMFNFAYGLIAELRCLYSGTNVPRCLYTRCKSMFDVILKRF